MLYFHINKLYGVTFGIESVFKFWNLCPFIDRPIFFIEYEGHYWWAIIMRRIEIENYIKRL
jgi:hypothetical protein